MKDLFDLAYKFRNSKVWKAFYEDEVFAVTLPDGQIGYCYIMGRSGEHMALSVHIGGEGFTTYRKIKELNRFTAPSEALMIQDCIQCSIEKKDMLSDEELEDLKAYCQQSGISFRAPFPQFTRYYPYCVPWHVTEPGDLVAIETALRIVLEMAGHDKKELGLKPVDARLDGEEYILTREEIVRQFDMFMKEEPEEEKVTVPLYSLADGKLSITRIPLPPRQERKLEAPTMFNEVMLKRLSRLHQDETLQCEVIRLPKPVAGEPPFFPAVLMAAVGDGMILQPVFGNNAVYDPNEMLESFLQTLVQGNIYPKKIAVRTEETEVLLQEFCQKAKIRLAKQKTLKLLDAAVDNMMEYAYSEDKEEEPDPVEILRQMSVEDIRLLPDAVISQLMEAEAFLPPDIVIKLKKALKK